MVLKNQLNNNSFNIIVYLFQLITNLPYVFKDTCKSSENNFTECMIPEFRYVECIYTDCILLEIKWLVYSLKMFYKMFKSFIYKL